MVIENKNIFSENDKKKRELKEEEIINEQKKQIEFKKTKEKINVEIEIEDEIYHLKELVEKWVISKETVDKVISWKDISEEEIKEIFEKIDEIEELKDVDNYLPQNLRITKEDYLKAVNDDIFRVQTITKIDSALTLLSNQANPDSAMGLNLFSWFLAILDKNLIKIQENTIDVKDSLKSIDIKKWLYKDKRTKWQKFLDFLREIFK